MTLSRNDSKERFGNDSYTFLYSVFYVFLSWNIIKEPTEPSGVLLNNSFRETGPETGQNSVMDRNLLEIMTIADTCSLSRKVVSVESVLALNWTFRNFSAEPLWVKSASWFFSSIAYLIISVDFRMLDDTSLQVRSDFVRIRIIWRNLLYF